MAKLLLAPPRLKLRNMREQLDEETGERDIKTTDPEEGN